MVNNPPAKAEDLRDLGSILELIKILWRRDRLLTPVCLGVAQRVKNRLQCGRPGFDPLVGKIPWRRPWQLTPVFLPRESHRQRSLEGYSPWGLKESDMTEAT